MRAGRWRVPAFKDIAIDSASFATANRNGIATVSTRDGDFPIAAGRAKLAAASLAEDA
jgi:hypothetical protein